MVGLVEFKAGLEDGDELFRWILFVVPHDIIVDVLLGLSNGTILGPSEVENVLLAIVNHLLSDLNEESSHPVVCIVVPGDGVDHLDAIHQGGECILDSIRGAIIEWFDEFFESREVLYVVLGLV